MAEQVDKKITQLKPKDAEKPQRRDVLEIALGELEQMAQPAERFPDGSVFPGGVLFRFANSRGLSDKTGYWAEKVWRKALSALEPYRKVRGKIIEELGEKNPKNPTVFSINNESDKYAEFVTRDSELRKELVVLEGINWPVIMKQEDARLFTPAERVALSRFFESPEPKDEEPKDEPAKK